MYKYETIIYWSEEDGAFVAEVPELLGCMAHGSTPSEALANVNDAISQKEGGSCTPDGLKDNW